jgi:hypothetical protein
MVMGQYFRRLSLRSNIARANSGDVRIWSSYVVKIAEEDFIKISQGLHPDLVSVRDGEDDSLPPMTI